MRFILFMSIIFVSACQNAPHSNQGSVPASLLSRPAQSGSVSISNATWENAVVSDDVVRVGVMLPLTGRGSDLGQDMKKAIEMALFQAKSRHLVLKLYDTGLDLQKIVEQAKTDQIELIIGPVFSQDVSIVAQAIDKPILSFTTDSNVLRPGVYTFGLTLSDQLRNLLAFGKAKGKNRLAMILPQTQNGSKTAEEITQLGLNMGMEVSKKVFYPLSNLSATDSVMKSFSQGANSYDLLFVGGNDADLEGAVSFLQYYEINPDKIQYLGTASWEGETKKTLARTKAWVSGISRESESRFNALFSQQYGSTPKNLAILAYDAMMLVSYLSEDGSISRHELLDPNGYMGLTGLFRFSESGLIERGLEIRRLSPTGINDVLLPAKRKF